MVGPEARAAGAAEGEGVMQFLDPVLAVAARGVDLRVQPLGRVPQVGDHEARIVAQLAARVRDDFGLDDHASGLRPVWA